MFSIQHNPAITGKSTSGARHGIRVLCRPIDMYLNQSRPILLKSSVPTNFLWISSRTGQPMTKKNLGTLVSKITLRTLGVDVSPHLFRTAGATTAAMYGGNTPHLATALLGHTDPRVTEKHYNRATSINAAKAYAALVKQYLPILSDVLCTPRRACLPTDRTLPEIQI